MPLTKCSECVFAEYGSYDLFCHRRSPVGVVGIDGIVRGNYPKPNSNMSGCGDGERKVNDE